jgi:hypothetical protein
MMELVFSKFEQIKYCWRFRWNNCSQSEPQIRAVAFEHNIVKYLA